MFVVYHFDVHVEFRRSRQVDIVLRVIQVVSLQQMMFVGFVSDPCKRLRLFEFCSRGTRKKTTTLVNVLSWAHLSQPLVAALARLPPDVQHGLHPVPVRPRALGTRRLDRE